MEVILKAKAKAREFPRDAYPLKVGGKYINDGLGNLIVTLDGTHPIEPVKEIRNTDMFVTVGKQWLGDLIMGIQSAPLSYIAVGSGTTPPAVGDTNVETIVGARHLYTNRYRIANIATFSAFFGSSENNGTWGNCGLFDTLTGGTMFCHSTFSPAISKSASNTQTIGFDITIS